MDRDDTWFGGVKSLYRFVWNRRDLFFENQGIEHFHEMIRSLIKNVQWMGIEEGSGLSLYRLISSFSSRV